MPDDELPAGFQPSVFDRLIDADASGSNDRRGYTESQLFDAVRRDLEELLNTRRPTFDELGIDNLLEVQNSVIAYGLPDFSSLRSQSDAARRAIGKEVEAAIATFEPRLTDVVVTVHDPDRMKDTLKEQYQQMAVYFHIDAKLRMDPSPPVAFETVLELAQGRHVVRSSEFESMTDSERLFGFYDRELTFIRRLALDFKTRYPRVANRLSLDAAGASADPHVERMIEAFALLTANVQVKLEDEFPELTDALLSVLYPHYLAPLPSMAIVQLSLNAGSTDALNGFPIPQHSPMSAPPVEGVACRFRTGYGMKVWPVEVTEAKLREPPYPPGLEPPPGLRGEVRAYLRVTVRCMGNVVFENLSLDTLRFFILGQSQLSVDLYEMLFTELEHVTILAENRRLPPTHLRPSECVHQVGFDPAEALLPYPTQAFAGYRLLTEFFAYPARFSFFDLSCWDKARANGLAGRTAEIVFYFNRPPRDGTIQGVQKDTFVTGCVPVINLFQKQIESFKVLHRKHEYALEPDVHDPHGYEVYSVDDVVGNEPTTGDVRTFRPFYSYHHGTSESGPPFWYASRRPRFRQKLDGRADLEGSVGSDVYLRLVDPALNPANVADETVNVKTTCLNRDLPKLLREAGEGLQFEMLTAAPVRVRCLRLPSPTLRPPLRKQAFWRLLSHMNLNYLSLSDPQQGRESIQEYLRLYDFSDPKTDAQLAAVAAQAVEGLLSVKSDRDVQFTGSQTAGGYARGVKIDIELDDEKFTGMGAYLFASVLERFLALYVSVNSFTRLTANTRRKDAQPWTWAPRAGEQVLV